MLRGFIAQFPSMATFATQLACCAAELGWHVEARQYVERFAAADFRDIPFDQNWLMSMSHLATACGFPSDTDRGRALYERLRPYVYMPPPGQPVVWQT